MKTRALVAAFALSAIVLGSGVSAFAYNGSCGNANGSGMVSLSPENQCAYEAMLKEYRNRIAPLQDKLSAKRLELNALSRNNNTKPETLSKLAGEVAELQAQIRSEDRALGDRMEKELGIRGYGMMGGMHGGRGHRGGGHMNGGMMDGTGHMGDMNGMMDGAGHMGGHRSSN